MGKCNNNIFLYFYIFKIFLINSLAPPFTFLYLIKYLINLYIILKFEYISKDLIM